MCVYIMIINIMEYIFVRRNAFELNTKMNQGDSCNGKTNFKSSNMEITHFPPISGPKRFSTLLEYMMRGPVAAVHTEVRAEG